MAKSSNGNGKGKSNGVAVAKRASGRWSNRAVKTSNDLKMCMSDVMSDLCGDRIDTRRAGSVVAAGRTMLQTVVAEYKYGYPSIRGQAPKARTLALLNA